MSQEDRLDLRLLTEGKVSEPVWSVQDRTHNPIIQRQDEPYDERFKAENVFSVGCDDHDAPNYWLLPDGVKNAGFDLLLPNTMKIEKVTFINTHNGDNNDR